MSADGVGDAALRRLVRDDVGAGQPFKELPEPGIARLERVECLEQILGGPVTGVTEHVPVDLSPQA